MTRDVILVDLALQGGGAHGAYTWGVLDRLLEEPWLQIEGISGTSAGAMNAAALISGHVDGGADGARAALELFWRRVSQAARLSPLQRNLVDVLMGRWMTELSASSKLIAEWDFLCMLRDEGRRSAQDFLDRHERDVGVCSTLDLDALVERV